MLAALMLCIALPVFAEESTATPEPESPGLLGQEPLRAADEEQQNSQKEPRAQG